MLCAPRMARRISNRCWGNSDQLCSFTVMLDRSTARRWSPPTTRTALVELIDLLCGYGHRSLVYLAGVPQSASNARRIEAITAISMIIRT